MGCAVSHAATPSIEVFCCMGVQNRAVLTFYGVGWVAPWGCTGGIGNVLKASAKSAKTCTEEGLCAFTGRNCLLIFPLGNIFGTVCISSL